MKILRILLLIILLLGVSLGISLAVTRPEPPPDGSESARRLEPGPYAVDLSEEIWIDPSRRTDANGDYEGDDQRSFRVAVWSPMGVPGPYPLLVYSHGFMSTRHGGTHIAEHMASHGYVVIAADFPLTSFTAPGDPNADDVVHQPADVSFLIDRALALRPDQRAFSGGIDRSRIGVLGLSLGGLTTTLVAFHPTLADPRVSAAISIAGPSAFFGPAYFDFADVPFLMIAGTHDAMIPYAANAQPIPDLIRNGGLLTLAGGSHAGFSYPMSGPMRILGNPDELGCASLMQNLELEPEESPFANLGGAEEGMLDASDTPLPCEVRFEEALPAGRQQMLTVLGVRAFFEQHFSTDEAERAAHARYLSETLPREIAETSYTPSRRS